MSIHTLHRILEIEEEVSLEFKHTWILGNKFTNDAKNFYIKNIKETLGNKIEILGFLGYNEELQRYNLNNKSLLDLPDNNSVNQEAIKIYSKII